MLLMMLAFLVDQTQQIACPLFRAALAKLQSRRRLWFRMRAAFFAFELTSMAELWELLLSGHIRQRPVLKDSS